MRMMVVVMVGMHLCAKGLWMARTVVVLLTWVMFLFGTIFSVELGLFIFFYAFGFVKWIRNLSSFLYDTKMCFLD